MSEPQPHPMTLDPDALKELAEALVVHDDGQDRHWSIFASLLGRVTDEALYKLTAFGTFTAPEDWAKERMDLSGGEYRLAMKLWRLMRKAEPDGVPLEEWHGIKKARALLVDEVVAAGGAPAEWFRKAAAAGTTEAFEHEVDRYLERQAWTTFKVRVPVDTVTVIRAGMKRVMPMILEGGEPAYLDVNHPRYWMALLHDPRYEHKLLEALAVHALQTLPEPEFPTTTQGELEIAP